VPAVVDVSLEVAAGEVLGIAGPNGAGKSTIISLLLGFLTPDTGEVTLDGARPRDFVEREGVAYLPELMTLPPAWRADEALRRLAALAGIPAAARPAAVERVIDLVGIGEHRAKRLKTLSKGNLQRVGLAHALLVERRVAVFDEPTHGLDPVWTARFRTLVAELRRSDRAIVIASHNLDELERLCDRVAIIDHGRIQRIVSVREAAGAHEPRRWRIQAAAGIEALAAAFADAVVQGTTVACTADLAALNRGLAAAIAQGAMVSAVFPAESSLEEAFRAAVSQ
jgi:ABC-type multidrug transport system ATPase subunit